MLIEQLLVQPLSTIIIDTPISALYDSRSKRRGTRLTVFWICPRFRGTRVNRIFWGGTM